MSDVKNITSKILKDAEVERDSILAASEDEKNKIISKLSLIHISEPTRP